MAASVAGLLFLVGMLWQVQSGAGTGNSECPFDNSGCTLDERFFLAGVKHGELVFRHGGLQGPQSVSADSSVMEVVDPRTLSHSVVPVANAAQHRLDRFWHSMLSWRDIILMPFGLIRDSSTEPQFAPDLLAFSPATQEMRTVATVNFTCPGQPPLVLFSKGTSDLVGSTVLALITVMNDPGAKGIRDAVLEVDVSAYRFGGEPLRVTHVDPVCNPRFNYDKLHTVKAHEDGSRELNSIKALSPSRAIVFLSDVTGATTELFDMDLTRSEGSSVLDLRFSPPRTVAAADAAQATVPVVAMMAARLVQTRDESLQLVVWANTTVDGRWNQSVLLAYDLKVDGAEAQLTLSRMWLQRLRELRTARRTPAWLPLPWHGNTSTAKLDLQDLPDIGVVNGHTDEWGKDYVQITALQPGSVMVHGNAFSTSPCGPVRPFELVVDTETGDTKVLGGWRTAVGVDLLRDHAVKQNNDRLLLGIPGTSSLIVLPVVGNKEDSDTGTFPVAYYDAYTLETRLVQARSGGVFKAQQLPANPGQALMQVAGVSGRTRTFHLTYGGNVDNWVVYGVHMPLTVGNLVAMEVGPDVSSHVVLPVANAWGGWAHAPGALSGVATVAAGPGRVFMFGGVRSVSTTAQTGSPAATVLSNDLYVLSVQEPTETGATRPTCSSSATLLVTPAAAATADEPLAVLLASLSGAEPVPLLFTRDAFMGGDGSPALTLQYISPALPEGGYVLASNVQAKFTVQAADGTPVQVNGTGPQPTPQYQHDPYDTDGNGDYDSREDELPHAVAFRWPGCVALPPPPDARVPDPPGASPLRLSSALLQPASFARPAPRHGAVLSYLEPGSPGLDPWPDGALVLFGGGYNADGAQGCREVDTLSEGEVAGAEHLNDTWVYDLGAAAWQRLEPRGDAPPPLLWAAHSTYEGQVFVMGGRFFNATDTKCVASRMLYVLDFVGGQAWWRALDVVAPLAGAAEGRSQLVAVPSLNSLLVVLHTQALRMSLVPLPRRAVVPDAASLVETLSVLHDGDRVVMNASSLALRGGAVAISRRLSLSSEGAAGASGVEQLAVSCFGAANAFVIRSVGVRLERLTITGCSDSAVVVAVNSSDLGSTLPVVVESSVFQGNNGGDGAALHVGGGSYVQVIDSDFEQNTAAAGVLWANASLLELRGLRFSGNNGSGIVLLNSDALLDNITCLGNSSPTRGSCLAVYGDRTESFVGASRLVARDSFAAGEGGAVYVGARARLEVSNSSFSGCSASAGGAIAVDVDGCMERLVHTQLNSNRALNVSGDGGGAVSVTVPSCGIRWEDVQLANNSAPGSGGALTLMLASKRLLQLLRVSFLNNSAEQGGADRTSGAGGAAFISCGLSTVEAINCTFMNNAAATDGGALALEATSSTVRISDSLFSSNSAGHTGGAVAISGRGARLELLPGSEFRINSASVMVTGSSTGSSTAAARGGAVALGQDTSLAVTAATPARAGARVDATDGGTDVSSPRVVFERNGADTLGGAILCEHCRHVAVEGAVMEGNVAEFGAGLALLQPRGHERSRVRDVYFSRNRAGLDQAMEGLQLANTHERSHTVSTASASFTGGGGGGVYADLLTSGLLIEDSAFADNTAASGGALLAVTGCACDTPTCECRLEVSATNFSRTLLTASGEPTACTLFVSNSTGPRLLYHDNVTGLTNADKCSGVYAIALHNTSSPGALAAHLRVAPSEQFTLTATLLDFFGNPVSPAVADATRTVQATAPGADISGAKVAATAGLALFESMFLTSWQPGNYTVTFSAVVGDAELANASLVVELRGCEHGEEARGGSRRGDNLQCFRCSAPRVAGPSSGGITCRSCPPGAYCDAHVVVPLDGYWHSSMRSTQVSRCLHGAACIRNGSIVDWARNDSAAVQTFVGSNEWRLKSFQDEWRVQRWEDISNETRQAYMVAQCAPGYAGTLCAACASGYGRGGGFTCIKCLSQPWTLAAFLFVCLYMGFIIAISAYMHLATQLRAGITGRLVGVPRALQVRVTPDPTADKKGGVALLNNSAASRSINTQGHAPREPVCCLPTTQTGFMFDKDADQLRRQIMLERPGGGGTLVTALAHSSLAIASNPAAATPATTNAGKLQRLPSVHSRQPILAAIGKLMISYLQMLAVLRFVRLQWWPALEGMAAMFDQTMALSVWVAVDCMLPLPSSLWRTVLLIAVPVAALLLSAAFWMTRRRYLWRKRSPWLRTQHWLSSRVMMTSVMVMFYFYPLLTSTIISIFNCTIVDSELEPYDTPQAQQLLTALGKYWSMDTSLECYEDSHAWLAYAVGIPAAIIFGLGIPAAGAGLLYRQRQRLGTHLHVQIAYGFLYDSYQPQYYYWECIILLRKLAMVIMVVVLSTYGAGVQLVATMGVVFISLAVHITMRPFQHHVLDWLETLQLFALQATLFFLLWLELPGGSHDDGLRTAVVVLVYVVNLALVAVFLVLLGREAWHLVKRYLDKDNVGRVTHTDVMRATMKSKLLRVLLQPCLGKAPQNPWLSGRSRAAPPEQLPTQPSSSSSDV